MATTSHFSVADQIHDAIVSFANSINQMFTEFSKARAAAAMYEELSGLTDEQLDDMGLKRDKLARKIYSDFYK